MASRFFILLPLIVLIPDLYVWFLVIGKINSRWKYLHWLPLLLSVICIVCAASVVHNLLLMYIMMVILIGIYIPKIVLTLVSLPFKVASLFRPRLSRVGNWVGGIACLVTFVCAVYGLTYGWRQITVRRVTVTSDRLPEEFDGYRIAQISDLHLGTFKYSRSFISDVVTTVNQQEADMICFTGDIVNFHPNELDDFVRTLSKLKAKDGVYSVMGNHDYCEYDNHDTPEYAIHDAEMLIQMESAMGWRMLHNENSFIKRGNDSIAVIGVENNGEPPFKSYSDLPKALRGVGDSTFQLLLSHNPVHWRKEVLGSSNVDLMLAGHTHAMQLRIGGFSPSSFRYKEWGGLYREGSRALYVNTGTGGNFLFRFGAWPEITIITLKKK
jgi:predicted MPP superfamily phosphohydrolase